MHANRWNIFARELEDILNRRGYRLGHLDDRAGIHSQKVSRLQQSLRQPKYFPVLDPDELEEVTLAFELKEDEVLRLRAAVLATAIEEMLMERIHSEDAFYAAEQTFSLILEAIGKHKGDGHWFGKVRADS